MALFTSSTPHFFKIILHHNLDQGKLDLPQKFVERNGGRSMFYGNATLRLPNGAKWEVQLENIFDKVSFSRGWLEFMKFYSIKVGYFVVFKLKGCWCFDVVIFGLSATEIDYPITSHDFHPRLNYNGGGFDGRAPNLVVKIESEDDDEMQDEKDPRLVRKMKMRKNMKRLSIDDEEDDDEMQDEKDPRSVRKMKKKKKMMRKNMKRFSIDDEEDEDEDYETDYSRRKNNFRGSTSNYGDDGRSSPESMRPIHQKTPEPLTKKQEQVLRMASTFKLSRKNPSFMVTMRPSYIETGYYLSLPRFFAEKHLKESMDVKLELDNGSIWSVWCGVRWAFTRLRTEFKGGWKTFAVDNELQDRDVCVFEMIQKVPKVVFRVTIFRRPLN